MDCGKHMWWKSRRSNFISSYRDDELEEQMPDVDNKRRNHLSQDVPFLEEARKSIIIEKWYTKRNSNSSRMKID
jgi:hypothetical protein